MIVDAASNGVVAMNWNNPSWYGFSLDDVEAFLVERRSPEPDEAAIRDEVGELTMAGAAPGPGAFRSGYRNARMAGRTRREAFDLALGSVRVQVDTSFRAEAPPGWFDQGR
jgi:hypothetical protein